MSSSVVPRMPLLPHGDDLGDAAVNDYLARMDAGEVVDRNQFIAEHPESADALRSFFTSEQLFRQLIACGHSGAMPGMAQRLDTRAFAIAQQEGALAPWRTLPAIFGRYRVTKLIGRGAMGTVYRAQDSELDRVVALKIPHRCPDGSFVQKGRHLQEARAAAGLRHPNICAVFDVGQIDGVDFIAMEYVEGRPLSDFLRRDRRPPEATIVGLIRRLAQALQAAHAEGVVHRDLKPDNILVRKDGEPVLMDFGLACRPTPEGAERLSRDGMMIGSPAYMAPEQARGEGATVGPAADIYGLGVVFYELLTGRLPFTGSVVRILAKILTEDPPAILLLRPETDRELAGICHRMLLKRPGDRFASIQEVADVLKEWQHSKRVTASVPSLQGPLTSRPPVIRLKRLRSKDIVALTRSAQSCLRQRDYAMAVKLLSQIPQSQHSEESASTLHRAQDLAQEVDYLSVDIDDALAARDYFALETTLERFRELQPHNRRARELQRRLVRNGSVLVLEPVSVDSRPEAGVLQGHARSLILVGLGTILLCLIGWMLSNRYLADQRLLVEIQADDPAATVRIDDEAVRLDRGHGVARLIPGPHQVDARLAGAPPQVFGLDVVRGRQNRLSVVFRQPKPEIVVAPVLPAAVPDKEDVAPLRRAEGEENSIGMRFVRIPAGEFWMGSPSTEIGREANEGPQRRIRFTEPFLAAVYEVTQTEYVRVMRHAPIEDERERNEAQTGRSRLPIDRVTWYDALDFCNQLSLLEGRVPAYRLTNVVRNGSSITQADVEHPNTVGYRLPTEAEWEYLCRAGSRTPFFFGTQCNGTQANVNGGLPYGGIAPGPFLNRICAVGGFPPNAFGLFDTHGNVAEWCWSSPSTATARGRDAWSPVRGGGITIDSRFARSAANRRVAAGSSSKGLGFRIVRGLNSQHPFN